MFNHFLLFLTQFSIFIFHTFFLSKNELSYINHISNPNPILILVFPAFFITSTSIFKKNHTLLSTELKAYGILLRKKLLNTSMQFKNFFHFCNTQAYSKTYDHSMYS